MSQFDQNPKRAGAGAMGSKPTGKGPRQGNTPHTDTGNNEEFPQRHTTRHGQVEFTSENFPTRANTKTAKETFSGDGGQFEFQGTPTESSHLQRERILNREEVQNAKPREGRVKKNEREQRQSNPRGQR